MPSRTTTWPPPAQSTYPTCFMPSDFAISRFLHVSTHGDTPADGKNLLARIMQRRLADVVHSGHRPRRSIHGLYRHPAAAAAKLKYAPRRRRPKQHGHGANSSPSTPGQIRFHRTSNRSAFLADLSIGGGLIESVSYTHLRAHE